MCRMGVFGVCVSSCWLVLTFSSLHVIDKRRWGSIPRFCLGLHQGIVAFFVYRQNVLDITFSLPPTCWWSSSLSPHPSNFSLILYAWVSPIICTHREMSFEFQSEPPGVGGQATESHGMPRLGCSSYLWNASLGSPNAQVPLGSAGGMCPSAQARVEC